MRIRFTTSIVIFSLCFAFTGLGSATAALRDPATNFFNESFGDFKDELETAREEGKKAIMLFFEMDECPFCHRMKTTIMNRSEVQDYFREQFKIFSVDIEGDVEMVDFDGTETTQKAFSIEKHRIRATPVIAFFDLEGKQVMRYTGAAGNSNEFMLLGKFIADGHYKTMKFTQYKRQQRKAK